MGFDIFWAGRPGGPRRMCKFCRSVFQTRRFQDLTKHENQTNTACQRKRQLRCAGDLKKLRRKGCAEHQYEGEHRGAIKQRGCALLRCDVSTLGPELQATKHDAKGRNHDGNRVSAHADKCFNHALNDRRSFHQRKSPTRPNHASHDLAWGAQTKQRVTCSYTQ